MTKRKEYIFIYMLLLYIVAKTYLSHIWQFLFSNKNGKAGRYERKMGAIGYKAWSKWIAASVNPSFRHKFDIFCWWLRFPKEGRWVARKCIWRRHSIDIETALGLNGCVSVSRPSTCHRHMRGAGFSNSKYSTKPCTRMGGFFSLLFTSSVR